MTTSTVPLPTPPSASGQFVGEWADTTAHSPRNWPLERWWTRGRERVALLGLLISTAILYLWDLGASGYGNDFYAAAVQAGTKSWKAFFFGSFDSSNFITVDKPPASLWPMEIAGRIFGFNSWSMLAPQALEGVLAVWLLYAMVKRWFGTTAGLLAGVLLAITPVAVLMFRFNNPDALMTLLIVLAAYCVTRALEAASTTWLLWAGAMMGFSFLAKGLQPFTVLPALAVAYAACAPTSLRRRLLQLLGAAGTLVAGAGWWLLIVQLTPASDRPYIGGSGDNSALGLALGYNGLSRITGSSGGSGPGGGGGGANFSGSTGLGRLFNSLNGGQISWLLPAALIAIAALVALSARAARTDRTRAAVIIFGGWLLVTGGVLSYASGIIHTYYTVELAPAIAALVAIGAVVGWRERSRIGARVGLAAGTAVTAWWSVELLHRSSGWHPWVADMIIFAGVCATLALILPAAKWRRAGIIGVAAGVLALGGGSAAYALDTASTPHDGSIPSAGPSVSNAGGFGGFPGRGARPSGVGPGNGARPAGGFPGGFPAGGTPPSGGFPGGSFPGAETGSTGSSGIGSAPSLGSRQTSSSSSVNSALTKLLKATDTTWAAATIGSQTAGPLELSSGKAVMAIGGFSGGDNSPTLAQFEKYVAQGKIRYFIAGGIGGGPGGGASSGSAITSWVESHFASTTVGGATVYDLTKATSS